MDLEAWVSICVQHVRGSCVYLDAAAAELCHVGMGLPSLLDYQAASVRLLSDSPSPNSSSSGGGGGAGSAGSPSVYDVEKAVCIVGELVSRDETAARLRRALRPLRRCCELVLVSLLAPGDLARAGLADSAAAGEPQAGSGADVELAELVEACEEWVCTSAEPGLPWRGVKALHVPVAAARLGEGLALLPSCSTATAWLPVLEEPAHHHRAGAGAARGVATALSQLPPLHQRQPRQLAVAVARMLLANHNVRQPKLWACGPGAELIAAEVRSLLADMQAPGSAAGSGRPASVVLIDRTLDLVEPSLHRPNMLGRLLGHHNVLAPSASDVGMRQSSALPLLTLTHPSQPAAMALLDTFLSSSEKASREAVCKQLVACAKALKVELPPELVSGSASSTRLTRLLQAVEASAAAWRDHAELLQMAHLVADALAESRDWDELAAAEKVLLPNAADDSGVSLLAQVERLASSTDDSGEMRFSVPDIVALASLVYSLNAEGTLTSADEKVLKSTLGERIMKERKGQQDLPKEVVNQALDLVFERLNGIASARGDLPAKLRHFRLGMDGSTSPLLAQVVAGILHPSKPEVPGLKQVHDKGGARGLLKTGLGMFGGMMGVTASEHPADAPLIFLVMLGGVTPHEIACVRDKAREWPEGQVVVVGTQLLSPQAAVASVVDCDGILRKVLE